MSEILNILEWRAATPMEVVEFLKADRSIKMRKGAAGGLLIVRSKLVPVDVYAYLRARFGVPNGFQNFLRRDDSDNWIHWEFNLKVGRADIRIAGTSREIHFAVSEFITDEQWKQLIMGIIPLTHVEQNGIKAATEVASHVHRKAHSSPVLRPLPG